MISNEDEVIGKCGLRLWRGFRLNYESNTINKIKLGRIWSWNFVEILNWHRRVKSKEKMDQLSSSSYYY